MQETKSFISFGKPNAGLIFEEKNHARYPLNYYNIISGEGLLPSENRSYYVFIYEGIAKLDLDSGISCELVKDTYFSHHGQFSLTGSFKAVAIEIFVDSGKFVENNYKAVTHIGGVVEEQGRLKYIDGCTDSLLVPPVKKGDPCLNHLHFPKSIVQTPHTHPTHRIGMVIRGQGMCVTPFGDLPLEEGCIFVIKEYDGTELEVGQDGQLYEAGTHKFNTDNNHLDVIAFHPDSDFGPEDENHPMVNRTIVKGVSARNLESIRTK